MLNMLSWLSNKGGVAYQQGRMRSLMRVEPKPSMLVRLVAPPPDLDLSAGESAADAAAEVDRAWGAPCCRPPHTMRPSTPIAGADGPNMAASEK